MKYVLVFLLAAVVACVSASQSLQNNVTASASTPCAFTFDVASQTTQVRFYFDGSVSGTVYLPNGTSVVTLFGQGTNAYIEQFLCIANIVSGTYFMNFTSLLYGTSVPMSMNVQQTTSTNQLSPTAVSGSLCCGPSNMYYYYEHQSSSQSFSIQLKAQGLNKLSTLPNLVYQQGASYCPINFNAPYSGTSTVNYQGITYLSGPATPGTYIVAIMNNPIYNPSWTFDIGVCEGSGCSVNFGPNSAGTNRQPWHPARWLGLALLWILWTDE